MPVTVVTRKQWVKPTVVASLLNAASVSPSIGVADGLGATGVGPYYS